jgi:L-ascorbate metabolism protein UlaG (beta-lactamase superfamily)
MVQRRAVVVGLSALPALPFAAAFLGPIRAQEAPMADAVATAEGELAIHPVEHASLVLVLGDTVIYVDPVGSADLYAGLPAPTAILITHEHQDHFDADLIAALAPDAPIVTNPAVFDMLPEELVGNATALANGDTGALAGIPVEAVPAYNITPERQNFHPQGRDNGYILTFGDTRVLIAGDTEDTPELRGLSGIDVAFLPMNLPYTMTVEQAAEAVNAFRPAIVYPYHYGDSDLDAFEAAVEDGIEVRRRNWYPHGAS